MKAATERAIVVTALKQAAPYIRMYKGKTFVVKAGGAIFASHVAAAAGLDAVRIHQHAPDLKRDLPASFVAAARKPESPDS